MKLATKTKGMKEDREMLAAGKVNIAPSWQAVLPLLLLLLKDGVSNEGQNFALKELRRMAEIADQAGGKL